MSADAMGVPFEVFTPLLAGQRVRFKVQDVTLVDGDPWRRGPGEKAIVEIDGLRWKVIGRECSLPDCWCDAEIIPVVTEGAA